MKKGQLGVMSGLLLLLVILVNGQTNPDVNTYDQYGFTPLMNVILHPLITSKDTNIQKAKQLIDQGADVNAVSQNADRDTPLNIALMNSNAPGSFEIAKMIVNAGANVNQGNAQGLRPIHTLLRNTDYRPRKEMMELILAHGAEINIQDNSGNTQLHLAVNNFDQRWVEYLVNTYGQIINFDIKNSDGLTALELARKLGFVSTIPGTTSVEMTILQRPQYLGNNFDLTKVDDKGRNGLMLAIKRGDYDFAKRLLERTVPKAPINAQAKNGKSALHFAVLATRSPRKFVKLLLDAGANPNLQTSEGLTPLMLVPQMNVPSFRVPVAEQLIAKGANVSIKDKSGKTVFDLAKEDQALLKLLQKNKEMKNK